MLFQTVRGNRPVVVGIGRYHSKPWPVSCLDSLLPHEFGNGIYAALAALLDELAVDARTAIVLMAWKAVDPFDFSHDLVLLFFRFRGLPVKPFVKCRAGHFRGLGKAR